MILFFVALIFLMWRTLKVMPRVKPQQIKPASNQSVSFADIAGVDEAKAELQEIVEFLRDPKPFHALGAKVPKGILLHGPPGHRQDAAREGRRERVRRAVLRAVGGRRSWRCSPGLGAARIRRLFAIARKHEPAIIFIDELDAVGGRRGSDISGEKDQTLNQLLVEMDGFAVERPRGRDRRLEPAREARPGAAAPGSLRPPGVRRAARRARAARACCRCTRATSRWATSTWALVAQQTSGLTGADLANICNEAAIFAARRGAQGDRRRATSTRRSSA